MANPCECPPVASRGLFKYLTYLIPIRQCSQHRGPGIVYRGIVKLREGASVVNYYISSVPVGSVASYLSTVDFGSSILNCIIAKCSFFLNVIKPPLEKLVTYIGNYYSTEHEIPEDETASVGESTGKVSKSHSKQSEADIISAKSVGSAKTVSTTKSGGSVKSTDSEKSKVSKKSAGSEKSTVSDTSAGLEKFTISEKSIGIEKPIFLEKTTDSVKSKGSATSSDIKSGQVKLVPNIAKQPTVEPPRITPEVDTKWSQLKSRIRRSLENILRAIQYVLNVILSALQYVFNLILKPFEVTFTGMVNILKGTKDKFVSAGTCTYDYLANCPLWIYIYILFVCLTVGYIIYQTYITYKGRLWSQATKIPTRVMYTNITFTTFQR
ncbi:unnamed protein product [Nezara viridula]|uniref:Uncharacterized protein n=1 Tax=Nezara viridula TaxID=85310 RepID=A0A9P0E3U3_NEZVI|nr:unnamed protein product [Nezara viridula]